MPAAPAEVPHLASPENLPTGTTMNECDLPAQSANVGYLKDLWHAIQTQDITGKDALLALTQRPMSTPEPGSENLNAVRGWLPGRSGTFRLLLSEPSFLPRRCPATRCCRPRPSARADA